MSARPRQLPKRALGRYRKLLLARLTELRSELRIESERADAGLPLDEQEHARRSHDEYISNSLNDLTWMELRQVEGALERLEKNGFGLCQDCGDAIPPKRLDVIPWASYCLGCEERGEAGDLVSRG